MQQAVHRAVCSCYSTLSRFRRVRIPACTAYYHVSSLCAMELVARTRYVDSHLQTRSLRGPWLSPASPLRRSVLIDNLKHTVLHMKALHIVASRSNCLRKLAHRQARAGPRKQISRDSVRLPTAYLNFLGFSRARFTCVTPALSLTQQTCNIIRNNAITSIHSCSGME
jgi:hypothetical protein